MTAPYLFLVHPGSAMGSANFNLGQFDARAARSSLATEMQQWTGHLITLRGAFDDEIADYAMFANTIDETHKRLVAGGYTVISRKAHDPEHARIAVRLARDLKIPLDARIVCTGAWASHGDSGCVNATRDALKEAGYTNVVISDFAVYESEESEDDEMDEAA